MRTESSRRGQAMIEMAIGMLVFVLILGGLFSFGSIIPEAMRYQAMVRRLAGYEAQGSTSGNVDGSQQPSIDSVLSEQEIRPLSAPETLTDCLTRPLEFSSLTVNFSVDLDPGTADWIWGGKTTFRGLEECHMPIMKIPEFPVVEEEESP